MGILLFVTAKMPADRVNKFLSEHQTLDDIIPNSIYALIRDRDVSFDDIDSPGTEPPVEDFESDFIGATDDELWRTLAYYSNEDSKREGGISVDQNILVALDQISETNDTIKMLYNPQHGGKHASKQAWRVDFLYAWEVTSHLPEEEGIYMDPDMRDENGVLDMQKIYNAKGVRLPPTWRKK